MIYGVRMQFIQIRSGDSRPACRKFWSVRIRPRNHRSPLIPVTATHAGGGTSARTPTNKTDDRKCLVWQKLKETVFNFSLQHRDEVLLISSTLIALQPVGSPFDSSFEAPASL